MRISDFIVCDDIRHEVGGKLSLMGVLTRDIHLQIPDPTAPFALRLGIFVRADVTLEEARPDTICLEIKYNAKPIDRHIIPIDPTKIVTGLSATISIAQLVLQGFGELLFVISMRQNDSVLGEPIEHLLKVTQLQTTSTDGATKS
jgi:hypothetical protein